MVLETEFKTIFLKKLLNTPYTVLNKIKSFWIWGILLPSLVDRRLLFLNFSYHCCWNIYSTINELRFLFFCFLNSLASIYNILWVFMFCVLVVWIAPLEYINLLKIIVSKQTLSKVFWILIENGRYVFFVFRHQVRQEEVCQRFREV